MFKMLDLAPQPSELPDEAGVRRAFVFCFYQVLKSDS